MGTGKLGVSVMLSGFLCWIGALYGTIVRAQSGWGELLDGAIDFSNASGLMQQQGWQMQLVLLLIQYRTELFIVGCIMLVGGYYLCPES